MKLITVEEHYMSKAVNEQYMQVMMKISSPAIQARLIGLQSFVDNNKLITDLDKLRISTMDKQGVDIQVISYGNNSPSDLPAKYAIPLCEQANNELAKAISTHPTRFAGLAVLPVDDPEAAADELTRTVKELGFKGASLNGVFNGMFFDNPRYLCIFERAVELDVPIYFHPGFVDEKISDYYFKSSEWSNEVTGIFSAYGYGWHMDVGLHMMRMILSGIFNKLPNLKLITGHWGELVPYFFDRIDEMLPKEVTGLGANFSEIYKKHAYITPSGIVSKAPAMLAIGEIGADNIMWSHDYPYVKRDDIKEFLNNLPISENDKEKIAYKNAEKIFKL